MIILKHFKLMQPRQIIEWTSSLLSNRILSMESSTYPIKTDSPCQEPQKHTPETYTRNSPCLQRGCMICSTPINHVCNLNSSNAPPTTADRPQPPANQIILLLTTAFQLTIQENEINELTAINHLYDQTIQLGLYSLWPL